MTPAGVAPVGRAQRPFLVLEATTIVSGTANGITMVAFPWLVLETTGDAGAAAAIAAAAALPLLVSMLFTGAVVDLLGRRLVAVVSDLLSMLSVALVPVLAATIGLDFGLLLLAAALGAVFDPAGATARETMLPEAARAAGIPLERANGIHESAYGFAYVLGPGIGGLLIGTVGTTATFWATAVAFGLSAVLMGLARMPGGGRPEHVDHPGGLWSATKDGLAFLWRDRVLRAVAILTALLVAAWLPIEGVVLPVLFNAIDQPAQLGFLVTAISGGGIVGALGYAALGARVRRRTALIVALVGCAIPVLGMAMLPPYPVMLALGAVTGLFFGAFNPITNLAMQARTPEVLRGRVVGAMGASAYAAGPVGYLAAGPAIEAWGPQPVFVALGVVLLAVCIASAFVPALHGLDDPPMPGSAADRERVEILPSA
ncbi:MAG TPA: MFS transporter [Candidatus Limnocylindrales bacterium]|nr:MFS transporter [Candidatus Limnocylindrales bacterium]